MPDTGLEIDKTVPQQNPSLEKCNANV